MGAWRRKEINSALRVVFQVCAMCWESTERKPDSPVRSGYRIQGCKRSDSEIRQCSSWGSKADRRRKRCRHAKAFQTGETPHNIAGRQEKLVLYGDQHQGQCGTSKDSFENMAGTKSGACAGIKPWEDRSKLVNFFPRQENHRKVFKKSLNFPIFLLEIFWHQSWR